MVRKCVICGEKIPDKSMDELVDAGYTILQVGRKRYIFCPKHNEGEIVSFIKNKVWPGVAS